MNKLVLMPYVIMSLVGVACGDDAATEGPTDEPRLAEKFAKSAVVVGVWVPGMDSGNTYFVASPDMPEESPDLSSAIELPDGLAWHDGRAVYFGNFESGELERYQVDEDYRVVRTGRMSLANYGIPYINATPLMLSDTRAYYLALDIGVGVVWDPSTMEIVDEIDVKALLREGLDARPGTPFRDGDQLFVPIRYENEEGTEVAADSTIAVFDVDSGDMKVVHDERAPGAWSGFVSDDGDYYTLADASGGALSITGAQELKNPALLRIRKGAGELDPDYLFDIGETLGTTGVYGLLPVSDTHFLVQSWPSDMEPDSVASPDEYWEVAEFEWQLLDAATQTAKPVEGVRRDIPTVLIPLNVDGRGFLQQELPDGEGAGLYEIDPLTAEASLKLTASGSFWFLGRLESD